MPRIIKHVVVVLVACVITAWVGLYPSGVLAKRTGPPPVEVEVDAVRYVAVHFGHGTQRVVEARNATTDEMLWQVVVYEVEVDPGIERDVQEVFITAIEVAGGVMHVSNERGERYTVDLARKEVVAKEVYVEEAYACKADVDCINTCAEGAVNGAWRQAVASHLLVCEDGCENKGTDSAKCVDGTCVAFFDGKEAPDCTRKKVTFTSVPTSAR